MASGKEVKVSKAVFPPEHPSNKKAVKKTTK